MEKEKTSLLHQSIQERDDMRRECEKQLEVAEQRLRGAIEEQERIAEDRTAQNQEVH